MQKGITIFRQNCFVSQYQKTSEGNHLVFQKISGIEIFYASEGYVTFFDFLSKFFCLTVPKISVGEPFSALEGYITFFGFLSNFFCLTVPK